MSSSSPARMTLKDYKVNFSCKFFMYTKFPVLEFLFNKFGGLRACNAIEKDSNAGGSCEILGHFKNNNFEEHLFLCASEKKVHCLYKK